MPAERVKADVATLNQGMVMEEINANLEIAARRFKKSGRAQTVQVAITISPSDVSPDIVRVAHKVNVKEAVPKPELSHAFLGEGGTLEVDKSLDPRDPALSQHVIPFPEKESL